eukprot:TRINITY_DN4464_c0_g1_i8.p1 TRINITY_DN4464_c0_g1~~TRINITY_DN4464_c0_g1_i8.p1  ORF type:complete len:491 (-),score=86.88 TRINITY_DN4464_c0_g1_i8:231-1703(-)
MNVSLEFGFDNPKYSDYVLVLKSGTIVHRKMHVSNLILSSHSKYFVALFTNDMKETREKEVEIELSSCESALFYSIIKSLYTGDLILPTLGELRDLEVEQEQQIDLSENGQDAKRGEKGKSPIKVRGKIKKEADKKEEESEFPVDSEEFQKVQVYVDAMNLLDRFSIEKRFKNCVDLLKKERNSILSACYQLSVLDESLEHITEVKDYKQLLLDFLAKEYVNFDKLWNSNEFLQLPYIALKSIFENDDLLVSCEATVLQALRKWINRNPEKRACYLTELLPLVRFTQIDLLYLTDYVMGYNNFFEVDGGCDDLSKLTFGAIRFHSFNILRFREQGCFPKGDFPESWLKKRAGYKAVETSETVDWQCDLDLGYQDSEEFYFRGVFFYFDVIIQNENEHSFSIRPNRVEISGENDDRKTNNNLRYTLQAFNYQTRARDYLFQDCTMSGVNMGELIDEKLKLSQNASPYIKPNREGKRIVHLFAYLTSIKTTK